MIKKILGLVIASLSSVSITMSLMLFSSLFFGQNPGASLLDLVSLMMIALFMTCVLSVPIFLAGLPILYGLHKFDAFNWLTAIISGGILGATVLGLLLWHPDDRDEIWRICLIGAASGAFCGWICWRIAVAGSKREPVT
jgi:hypothetical protein